MEALACAKIARSIAVACHLHRAGVNSSGAKHDTLHRTYRVEQLNDCLNCCEELYDLLPLMIWGTMQCSAAMCTLSHECSDELITRP